MFIHFGSVKGLGCRAWLHYPGLGVRTSRDHLVLLVAHAQGLPAEWQFGFGWWDVLPVRAGGAGTGGAGLASPPPGNALDCAGHLGVDTTLMTCVTT